jgi:hypothetical protein
VTRNESLGSRRGGEGVRVGLPRIVRGEARVTLPPAEAGEEPRGATVAAERGLSDTALAEAGLLTGRVFEFTENRREPIVSTRAEVREELAVRKSVTRRVQAIDEIVRRTEVEVEDLPGAAEARPPDGAQ